MEFLERFIGRNNIRILKKGTSPCYAILGSFAGYLTGEVAHASTEAFIRLTIPDVDNNFLGSLRSANQYLRYEYGIICGVLGGFSPLIKHEIRRFFRSESLGNSSVPYEQPTGYQKNLSPRILSSLSQWE